jgi:precorrin-2 dehydrogenase/sirohydrochlorin ferrochelatase
MYYPVFLDLRGKPVLVVGAGKVALRKVKGLLEANAVVTVVSPAHLPEFGSLPIKLRTRRFRRSDVQGQMLVFAATNDRKVNQAVGLVATAAGIAVNVADAPEECVFLVPARIRKDNLQVAISTGGESPRLAKELRQRMEQLLETDASYGLSR